MGTTARPFVSVVLATYERPEFLPIALGCFGQQTYADRELIVVDDGATHPVPEQAVRAAGGRLIRLEPGTPLGTKMNVGVKAARGPLCLKMDDDDWYAAEFLERMVAGRSAAMLDRCAPAVAFIDTALLFDLERWEIREADENHLAGGTLLFAREDWEAVPFRALPRAVDFWFVIDCIVSNMRVHRIAAIESYIQVRHGRGHLWTAQLDGTSVEASMLEQPLFTPGPEALLPAWALAIYRRRHETLGGADAPRGNIQAAMRLPVCPLEAAR